MMLFVANIGSTMAKMFAFVFTRITMVVCCRMGSNSKKAVALKNRQKLYEINNKSDGKLPILTSNEQTKEIITTPKSNLKSIKDSTTDVNLPNDVPDLPAYMRLNMLTGISNSSIPPSLASSRNSIGEKSKDAMVRMNELIRQNSVQDIEEINYDEPKRRRSVDLSPIQYYINETNRLTSNLDTSAQDKSVAPIEKDENPTANQEENNMKQVKKDLSFMTFIFIYRSHQWTTLLIMIIRKKQKNLRKKI
jgi:hypothetical protein